MVEKLPIGHGGSLISMKKAWVWILPRPGMILAVKGIMGKISPTHPDMKCPGYRTALAKASLKKDVPCLEARFTGRCYVAQRFDRQMEDKDGSQS